MLYGFEILIEALSIACFQLTFIDNVNFDFVIQLINLFCQLTLLINHLVLPPIIAIFYLNLTVISFQFRCLH